MHEPVVFNLDEPDMELFSTFHEKLQEAIKRSPEWAQVMGTKQREPAHAGGSGFDDMDDDIPF